MCTLHSSLLVQDTQPVILKVQFLQMDTNIKMSTMRGLILMAMNITCALCNMVDHYQWFGGTYCLLLQDRSSNDCGTMCFQNLYTYTTKMKKKNNNNCKHVFYHNQHLHCLIQAHLKQWRLLIVPCYYTAKIFYFLFPLPFSRMIYVLDN